jgi:hypothetical protein
LATARSAGRVSAIRALISGSGTSPAKHGTRFLMIKASSPSDEAEPRSKLLDELQRLVPVNN